MIRLAFCDSGRLVMEFMMMLKSRRPGIEPCGTPEDF